MQAAQGTETDFYQDWQASEGIPILTGFGIEDLGVVELGEWPRVGGRGAFINLGTKPSPVTSAYLCEIAPGGPPAAAGVYVRAVHVRGVWARRHDGVERRGAKTRG